jgi:uncharacterized membrane protein
LAFKIVALVILAVLLLFPAARMLAFLRRDKQSMDPTLREGPRQMVEQILILVLVLAFLSFAVLMHIAPF